MTRKGFFDGNGLYVTFIVLLVLIGAAMIVSGWTWDSRIAASLQFGW